MQALTLDKKKKSVPTNYESNSLIVTPIILLYNYSILTPYPP